MEGKKNKFNSIKEKRRGNANNKDLSKEKNNK